MTKKIKLAKCPFCGQKASHQSSTRANSNVTLISAEIKCSKCPSTYERHDWIYADTNLSAEESSQKVYSKLSNLADETIAEWNHRAT